MIFFDILILYGQHCPASRIKLNMSVVDSGYIKISYAFNATDTKDYNTYDDWQILEIGANLSRYYSFFVYNSDSLVSDWHTKRPNANAVPYRMGIQGKGPHDWSEYYFSEYFKDFTKNMLTVYTRMPLALEKANSYYVEEFTAFDWKIFTDTMSVMNYICQKATCHFRGRDYIAWFTMDIPINNGPWKFSGLPGLILKISDTEKQYNFECIGIEQSTRKFPIKKHNGFDNYGKKDRLQLLKFEKEVHEDYQKMSGLIPLDGNKGVPKKKYYPMELE